VEIYGISIPSSEVGGDLVDVVPLSDGSVFAYIADPSGHGLPASILMGMIKTAVRTQLRRPAFPAGCVRTPQRSLARG
jgi:serine phosphatase RsbU (regulator of sigma subunit)